MNRAKARKHKTWLTDQQKEAIRAEYAAGTERKKQLALRYNVALSTIGKIVAGVQKRKITIEVPGCPLRPRHLVVLGLLAQGKENADIADILGLSIVTIRCYAGEMYQILGISNRTAVVVLALREKWIDFPSEDDIPGYNTNE